MRGGGRTEEEARGLSQSAPSRGRAAPRACASSRGTTTPLQEPKQYSAPQEHRFEGCVEPLASLARSMPSFAPKKCSGSRTVARSLRAHTPSKLARDSDASWATGWCSFRDARPLSRQWGCASTTTTEVGSRWGCASTTTSVSLDFARPPPRRLKYGHLEGGLTDQAAREADARAELPDLVVLVVKAVAPLEVVHERAVEDVRHALHQPHAPVARVPANNERGAARRGAVRRGEARRGEERRAWRLVSPPARRGSFSDGRRADLCFAARPTHVESGRRARNSIEQQQRCPSNPFHSIPLPSIPLHSIPLIPEHCTPSGGEGGSNGRSRFELHCLGVLSLSTCLSRRPNRADRTPREQQAL